VTRRNKAGLLFLLAGLIPVAETVAADDVMVSAAISLRDVLEEAWSLWDGNGGHVVLNTAGSGVLLRQILQGAPVDLFISASPRELDELETRGMLVPGTRCTLAANRLVTIFPTDGEVVERFRDLPSIAPGSIAVGNPKTVPAGRYARKALLGAGLWEALENRLVNAGNVRQVVEYVARGDADAGLVYRTDAERFRERLRIGPEPEPGSYPPILYQAALVRGGPNPEKAAELLTLLRSGRAGKIFRQHGFMDPP
jgi:molybdate transport system substrate-binding protein